MPSIWRATASAAFALANVSVPWTEALQARQDLQAFVVLHDGHRVGRLTSSLARTGDGWVLTGQGTLGAPIDLSVQYLELSYDALWRPRHLTVEVVDAGRSSVLNTGFQSGVARTNVTTSELVIDDTWLPVEQDAVVLPDRVFAAYEAVAAQLRGLKPGGSLRVFVPPAELAWARVDAAIPDALASVNGPLVLATRYRLMLLAERPAVVELWVHEGRMLRLDLPEASISVRRTDLAAAAPP